MDPMSIVVSRHLRTRVKPDRLALCVLWWGDWMSRKLRKHRGGETLDKSARCTVAFNQHSLVRERNQTPARGFEGSLALRMRKSEHTDTHLPLVKKKKDYFLRLRLRWPVAQCGCSMHFFCIVFFPRSPDKSDVTRPWFWASVCISVPVMCTPVYIFICIHTTDLQLGVSQTISWFPCENSLLFSFQLNFLIINEPFNTIRSTTFPELSPGKPKGNVEFGRRLNGSSTNHIEDLQCMQNWTFPMVDV